MWTPTGRIRPEPGQGRCWATSTNGWVWWRAVDGSSSPPRAGRRGTVRAASRRIGCSWASRTSSGGGCSTRRRPTKPPSKWTQVGQGRGPSANQPNNQPSYQSTNRPIDQSTKPPTHVPTHPPTHPEEQNIVSRANLAAVQHELGDLMGAINAYYDILHRWVGAGRWAVGGGRWVVGGGWWWAVGMVGGGGSSNH